MSLALHQARVASRHRPQTSGRNRHDLCAAAIPPPPHSFFRRTGPHQKNWTRPL